MAVLVMQECGCRNQESRTGGKTIKGIHRNNTKKLISLEQFL